MKAQHQLHVRKYKAVAQEILDSAREGNSDPVEAGVKAHQQAEVVEDEETFNRSRTRTDQD